MRRLGRLSRREFVAGAAALPGLAKGSLRPRDEEDQRKRPNVLFIISDQHRADFTGYAGHPLVQTPNLDRLASQGTRISDLYCQAPLCFPARQSLITGQYLFHHGSYRNWHYPPKDQATAIHALRDAGYQTALFGKDHCNTYGFEIAENQTALSRAFLEKHPDARFPGQDAYSRREVNPERDFVEAMNPSYVASGDQVEDGPPIFFLEEIITQRVLEHLNQRDTERPFFVWASYLNPHPPLFPPQAYLDRFAEMDVPLLGSLQGPQPGLFEVLEERRKQLALDRLDDEMLRNITRAYYASLAYTDACIGRLLEGLKEQGLEQDTLVVYTSDHGEMLGQHGLLQKQNHYEGAVRVPGLVRLPGRIEAGAQWKHVAQHVDLMASVLEWAEVEHSADGRSFARSIEGEAADDWEGDDWEDLAYSELLVDGVRRPKVSQTAAENALPEGLCFQLRFGDKKWIHYVGGQEALFDLAEDPGETTNLIDEPTAGEDLAALRARFEALRPQKWTSLDSQTRDGRPRQGRRKRK